MFKWFCVLTCYALAALLSIYGFPETVKLPPFWKQYAIASRFSPYQDYFVYTFLILGSYCLFFIGGSIKREFVCRLKGYKWDLNDFCRGWLITGRTGSGKTASAIAHIIHQLFKNVKPKCTECMESGKCQSCKGTGHTEESCSICNGTGKTIGSKKEKPCKVCKGKGYSICKDCRGSSKCTAGSHNGLKDWGGVAVDQKGNFFKIIEKIAENYDQLDRLITLRVRSLDDPKDWKPKYKYNLLSYPGIPSSTYAKVIIDTASSLGQESGGSGGFFKTQAQLHIEKAIDLLKVLKFIKESPESIRLESNLSDVAEDNNTKSDLEVYHEIPSFVSLKNIYVLLTDKELMNLAIGILDLAVALKIFKEIDHDKHLEIDLIQIHFKQKFLNQPPDQLGGVIGTINNYLSFFTSDEICEVFCCEENSVEFEEVDNGIIFSVSMPQRFQSERVYVNTFMKMIYYTHALARFDRPDELDKNNLLIFIADEAQGVVTASKDGMTDYTVIDKIREARATVLFAAQSTTSFAPVMKKEQVDTLLLNLANQVHYTVSDENNAKLVADQIGKKEITKKSHGFSGGKRSVNYQKADEYKIKPHILRGMKKFECVLVHCESGHKKLTLKPITPDGKVPKYYSQIKR